MKYLKEIDKKIGLFSLSDGFDHHLTSLKRRRVNIFKIKGDDNIEAFSTIIIDMNYPLEMGYTLLDKINSNPLYSSINILAIVNSQEELAKVSTQQDNRICDYLTPGIGLDDFINVLESILSPESQPKATYSNAKVMVKLKGVITHISESGCLISSPALLKTNEDVELESTLLDEVTGSEKLLFKVSKNFPSPFKFFKSELDLLNLSDGRREALRKMILGWSIK